MKQKINFHQQGKNSFLEVQFKKYTILLFDYNDSTKIFPLLMKITLEFSYAKIRFKQRKINHTEIGRY